MLTTNTNNHYSHSFVQAATKSTAKNEPSYSKVGMHMRKSGTTIFPGQNEPEDDSDRQMTTLNAQLGNNQNNTIVLNQGEASISYSDKAMQKPRTSPQRQISIQAQYNFQNSNQQQFQASPISKVP